MIADVLRRILARKAEEVAERGRLRPLAEVRAAAEARREPPRGFAAALEARIGVGAAAVIAECKRASPSKGLLREPYDPAAIARSYERGGAACLSVLTDRDFFRGDDAHLAAARAACALPVLRKDFLVDPYQVWEAAALGADCVLLIVAALDDGRLADLHALALALGLDVLVEVHDEAELERALRLGPRLLGINNRDLRTFRTDLATTERLAPQAARAGACVVAESGIHTRADVARVRAAGVHAFLVGEAFMRAPDPGARLAELFAHGT
ncbi:indole-3-glycerol phosphate synthase TrpC [Inmirania thermothiophila]|uniref:Indole-3-glycerol phosphate synthase n=1 Tax=Inmirania thermothiophila TaxID=1750597 RepID=A0A3N1XSB2_9GAMM|nr:indole-3-glycerol phosphate synthase TrpC [Inmirania thermothiophila]ROR29540.1 indole-3-glycerol phosphate synthase [Inmirania thermothiophila]